MSLPRPRPLVVRQHTDEERKILIKDCMITRFSSHDTETEKFITICNDTTSSVYCPLPLYKDLEWIQKWAAETDWSLIDLSITLCNTYCIMGLTFEYRIDYTADTSKFKKVFQKKMLEDLSSLSIDDDDDKTKKSKMV